MLKSATLRLLWRQEAIFFSDHRNSIYPCQMSVASSISPYDKFKGHLMSNCSFIINLCSMTLRTLRIMNDNMAVQVTGKPLTDMKLPCSMKLVWATLSNGLATSAVYGLQILLDGEVDRGGTLA